MDRYPLIQHPTAMLSTYPFPGHFRRDPWEATFDRPLRLFNQHFGHELINDELLPLDTPLDTWALMHPHPARPRRLHNAKQSGISEINCTDDKFEVKLDVHQFLPEELSVEMQNDYVVVEGNHEEKLDTHGYIERHFKRRYILPENVKDDEVQVDLSTDGVLQISVPRMLESHHDPNKKELPIHMTGKPAIKKVSFTNTGHHFHSLQNTNDYHNGEGISHSEHDKSHLKAAQLHKMAA